MELRFPSGCDPGEQTHGTAKSCEEACDDFETVWKRLAQKKTEWHFELWRRSRDFHAWERTMWDQDIEMPTQRTVGRSCCFCGAEVTTESVARHIQEAHRGIGDPKTDHKSGS
jgi:hypothetical protein